MKLSLITPLYNRLELTRACIESAARTLRGLSYEWIFIDDGSTDGTREFLQTLAKNDRFRIVLNESPRGFAANNNVGTSMARAPLLCLLNNDTVLLPGWWAPMVRLARLLPDVACVGNVQREPTSGLIDHAGVYFHHDGYARHAGKDDFAPPREDYLQWPAVTAACCIIRRDVFLKLGGFDEQFRNGSEDVDFCLRAGQRGYRHFVANRSVIYHYISSSPGRMCNEEANQRLFRERWLEHLQTDLLARRTLRQTRRRGRGYIWKYAWRPWRFDFWRLCQALERIVSPLPPSQRLDAVPRWLFRARDLLRLRRRWWWRKSPRAGGVRPVFMVVGDTVQTAARTGVPTSVRRLVGAFGKMKLRVRPVLWKPATRSLCLLPPELSIGLAAEALRTVGTEPSAPSIYHPSAGDVGGPYSDTPAMHELPGDGLPPPGSWVLLPEVVYGGRMELLLEYIRRHHWRLAVIVYDMMPSNEPQFFPQGAANDHEMFLRAISGADLILPVSNFVAGDWLRFVEAKKLPSPECRVYVPGTDLCVQPRGAPPPREPTAPMRVLCVSTITPRKNLRVLIDAFDSIFASRPELRLELSLVGMPQLFSKDNVPDAVVKFVARHPGKVHWSDRLEYGALCKAYADCDFTVFPSLLEGRGMPITESLWFGRPCICANLGAMVETAAGGGCLTVDPHDPQAFADAILALAESPERLAALAAEIPTRPLRTWEEYAGDLFGKLADT